MEQTLQIESAEALVGHGDVGHDDRRRSRSRSRSRSRRRRSRNRRAIADAGRDASGPVGTESAAEQGVEPLVGVGRSLDDEAAGADDAHRVEAARAGDADVARRQRAVVETAAGHAQVAVDGQPLDGHAARNHLRLVAARLHQAGQSQSVDRVEFHRF